MNLLDAINDRSLTYIGSVMVIDMVGSTALKEQLPEPAWIAIYARCFTEILETMPETAELVKYTGDGMMFVFPEGQETPAINTAIKVQEKIDKLRQNENMQYGFSVAITTGRFKRIPIAEGRWDYIGSVVDRAFRLCSAAVAKAIFVDSDTTEAANVRKIQSNVGFAEERTKYALDEHKIELRGFKDLVPVKEIHWARDRFGLESEYVESISQKAAQNRAGNINQLPSQKISIQNQSASTTPIRGIFDKWTADQKGGFINGEQERFFTRKSEVATKDEVNQGDRVYFIPKPPEGGPSPLASGVLKIGAELRGSIINKGDKYAFVSCESIKKYGFANVYAPLGVLADQFNIGDDVVFRVDEAYDKKKGYYTLAARDLRFAIE